MRPAGPPGAEAPAPPKPQRSAAQAAFLADLRATARRARAAAGTVERFHRVAGTTVRLRFAGDSLVDRVLPALAHVETAAVSDPALTVDLWETRTTGAAPAPPPWGPHDYRQHGRIRGFCGDGLTTLFNLGHRALTVLDTRSRAAWYWLPDARELSYIERAAPLRLLLHLWAADRGAQLVHAAGVEAGGGCVLVVGRSGRGKSSTALACLLAGHGYVGDDYCLLAAGALPRIESLYSSGKVPHDALERMPALHGLLANAGATGDAKALLFAHEHLPERISHGGPLRAIAIPSRPAGERTATTVRTAAPGEALAALAPSTMLQLAGSDGATLARLQALAAGVAAFHLELGRDAAGVAAAVAGLAAP